ncbi:hypothetical protein F5888DRAFT_1806360 [Russula emetica]|nr:hypothetical protein F5888DRAFT_1806360 [Russula emetica]
MSTMLAVAPSRDTNSMDQYHNVATYVVIIHFSTETLNNLTTTERVARTHPDVPPRLPPLPSTDHAEEMSRILFAPELIAPPPIVWLLDAFLAQLIRLGQASSKRMDLLESEFS